MPRAVFDMADRRPIWAMPDWVPARVRDALPEGWEVVVASEETDGSGDGVARAGQEVLDAVRGAQIYVGWGVAESVLEAGEGLDWVHSAAAGVAKSLTPAMLSSSVVFTNSAGTHAAPIAETVLAMLLHFGRGLDFAVEAQRRGEWWQAPFFEADAPILELPDTTVGIVGFGGIGSEVARRVAALGARVVALRRGVPSPGDAALEPVSGGGTLEERIDLVSGRGGFGRVLAEADVLVVTVPETPETVGLVDADALARLRNGALLINVARGRIVDEVALVEALSSGRLRGAALDVFGEEPLPEDHPLWRLPNVLLTPHVSGVTRQFWKRETHLILRNLERYLAGAPLAEWENVVDRHRGY